MSGSVAFDRSVGYYDQTRGLSAEAVEGLVRVLGEELEGRGRCLEIGVGTGLISLPLHACGVPMAGVDISGPMVAELVRKSGGRPPFPLVLGDATRLPFKDGSFGAALIRHVLHLIPEWRRCLTELARAVIPGGAVLVGHGDYPDDWREVQQEFLRSLGRTRRFVGWEPGDMETLDEAFSKLGASGRDLPRIEEKARHTLGDFIRQMGEGVHSWTWDLEAKERLAAAERTLAWALERFGTLDPPSARKWQLRWRVYDLAPG